MAASDPRLANRPVPLGAAPSSMDGARQLAQGPVSNRPVPTGQGGNLARPVPLSQANRGLAPTTPAVAEVPPEEEQAPDAAKEIARNAPPWLISTVVHLVIIIVMAFIGSTAYLLQKDGIKASFVEPEPEEWSEKLGEQNEIPTDIQTTDPKQEMVISESPLPPVVDPASAPPDREIFDENATPADTSKETAPDVGMLLKGRQRGRRGDMLAAYGGNRSTEDAVIAALEWLARNQKKDGSWSLTGPYSEGAKEENNIGAMAMALIAFQGHGDIHIPPREAEFKPNERVKYERAVRFSKIVDNGWKALLKFYQQDGSFTNDNHYRLYAQGQAMIALCELYAMTKDLNDRESGKHQAEVDRLKVLAQRAVDYAVLIQDKSENGGGWRYEPKVDSDVSVTGWYMIGLQSARMGGLNVPQDTLDRMSKFLDKVSIAEGRQYRYRIGGHTTAAMTAEGLLCRQYLGWKREDPRLAGGVQFMLDNPMVWKTGKRNVYYWYYATQALHHMERQPWWKWNNVMKQMLPTNQVREGPERGSWNPAGDEWGAVAGRLYVTCLSTYMLEVYYRHLPIYRQRL